MLTVGQPTNGENSPAGLSANVDSLCTSETRVTVSQKLSWLTHSNPQREGGRGGGNEGGRERESIELDTEERIVVGGWDALKVVYDNEGQF